MRGSARYETAQKLRTEQHFVDEMVRRFVPARNASRSETSPRRPLDSVRAHRKNVWIHDSEVRTVRHRVESTASLRAGSLKRGEERERAEIRARSNASITAPLVNTMPPTTTLPERLCSVFGKRTCNQSKDPPALVHARARLRHFAPPLGVVRLLRREFARHYPACSLAAIKFAALVTRW
jgi:hypothetical protein